MFKITRVKKEEGESTNKKIIGFVSITIDDNFVINGVRIIENNNKRFVAMPSRKTTKGTYKDICHPITNDLREYFEKTILEEFDKLTKDGE